ncbi:MAG: TIGR03905 family TSCPD domain-containing protein [Muribaculaceae bacterium]|nr:TIGR03905 family TSCPD domain-containing protein [Muribaculaceae bacterium]
MEFEYRPQGTCSQQIHFEIDEQGLMHNIRFYGGCPGNTVGLTMLAEGMNARDVATRLRGTDCRGRGTSCPDQFAIAIEHALATIDSKKE